MATALLDFSKPHVLRNEPEYDAAIAYHADLDDVMGRRARIGVPERKMRALDVAGRGTKGAYCASRRKPLNVRRKPRSNR
jgi:hypothetical protein